MEAFAVLGDPVRRRVLELLGGGERTAGSLTETVREEYGISQPAVSQHLRVLREAGFVRVRAEGPRRVYAVDARRLHDVDAWLDQFRRFWTQPLDALETELAREAKRPERASTRNQTNRTNRTNRSIRKGPSR